MSRPAGPRCPNDGSVLNLHAVLMRLPVDDAELVDQVLGEVLTDVFTCPVCGYTDGMPHLEPASQF